MLKEYSYTQRQVFKTADKLRDIDKRLKVKDLSDDERSKLEKAFVHNAKKYEALRKQEG